MNLLDFNTARPRVTKFFVPEKTLHHETILHEAGKINIKSTIAHLDIFGPNSKPRICEVRPPRGSVSRGLAVPVSLTYHKLVEMLVLTRFANHR